MKKIFALILALVMALSLAACGSDKDDTVAGGNTESTGNTTGTGNNSTESTRGTTDSTTPPATEPPATNPPATTPPATNPPATTPPATQPSHTHSYAPKATAATCTAQGYTTYTCSCGHTYTADFVSPKGHSYSQTVTAPTCTAQGYTTHTCSCGDTYKDSYTTPSHNYTNYVCSKCGGIDKSHAYEYLVSYIKQNGTTTGTETIIKDDSQNATFELLYDAQNGYAEIMMYFYSEDQFFYSALHIDLYYYYTSFDNCKVTGYLDAKNFTNNSAISYSTYEGSIANKQDIIDLARISCCDMVDWLSWYLSTNNVGITIADLGFTSFK